MKNNFLKAKGSDFAILVGRSGLTLDLLFLEGITSALLLRFGRLRFPRPSLLRSLLETTSSSIGTPDGAVAPVIRTKSG